MRLPALASRPLASRQDEPTSAALTASGVTVPEKASKYVGGTMMEARRMFPNFSSILWFQSPPDSSREDMWIGGVRGGPCPTAVVNNLHPDQP